MPGLLRARRRLRPRQRADQGPPRRRRVGRSTARRCGRRCAHVADWCFVLARTEPGSQRHHGLSLPARADGPGRRRGPADRAAHRRLGVQRGLLHRRPHRRRPRRRRARATAGGSRWACSASSAASRRSASRSASPASSTASSTLARANGAFDDPVLRDRLAPATVELEVMRLNALRTLAGDDSGAQGRRGQSISKLRLGDWHREPRRARDGRASAPAALTAARPPYDLDDAGSGSSCSPAPTRSTAAPTRSSATSSPSACSACPGSPREP